MYICVRSLQDSRYRLPVASRVANRPYNLVADPLVDQAVILHVNLVRSHRVDHRVDHHVR